jgi:hypothetical protein
MKSVAVTIAARAAAGGTAARRRWRPLTLSEAHALWQVLLCEDLFAPCGPPLDASRMLVSGKRCRASELIGLSRG